MMQLAGKRRSVVFTRFDLPLDVGPFTRTDVGSGIHSIRDKHTNEAFEKIAAFRAMYEIKDETLRNLLDKAKASLTARKGKQLQSESERIVL